MENSLASEYEISESNKKVLSTVPLSALNLSIRVYNSLRRYSGIETVFDVIFHSDEELSVIKGIGVNSLVEIHKKLLIFTLPENIESFSEMEEDTKIELSLETEEEISKKPKNALMYVPIDVLDLSVRVYNALMRGGIKTIADLITKTDGELLCIRNLGVKTLEEIKNKLEDFDVDKSFSEYVKESKTNSPKYLNDKKLMNKVAKLPLDGISTLRLGLPTLQQQRLKNLGVDSLEQLMKKTHEIVTEDFVVRKHLDKYLKWITEQDKDIWFEEVEGKGISPICRMRLAKMSLADFVDRWLSLPDRFDDRDRQVIRWRYGLNGTGLTLSEVGKHLGVTRERVRQIQSRSITILNGIQYRVVIHPLEELLIYLLKQTGGLMNVAQITDALQEELVIGDVEPIGVIHLVLERNNYVKWLRKMKIWGLKSCPLSVVSGIQSKLVQLLEDEYVPLPTDELIARFKATQIYLNYQGEIEDAFLFAILRTHPEIYVESDGKCGLIHWENQRLDEMILALRKIGDPIHFTKIAEKTNALLESEMQTSAHNFHAILGRYTDLFVRVGHGIFGLREWGLPDDGNLANAAHRVLSDAGKPLHHDTITVRVLETWQANPTSIYAALQNDNRFISIGSGVYWLRERIAQSSNEKETNFSDLFGNRLEKWQEELSVEKNSLGYDAHAESDAIRHMGTDFFN